MGRPRKLSILYFSHDVDAGEHWKFRMLRDHYAAEKGWAMEGRFWALNGLIGAAENCRLDLRRAQIRVDTAEKLELSLQDFDEFITFCSDPDGSDLLHNEDGVLWTDRCKEELEAVLKSREHDHMRDSQRKKPGKSSFPSGKPNIPPGKLSYPVWETSFPAQRGREGLEGGEREMGNSVSQLGNPPPSLASPPPEEPQEKTNHLSALRTVNPGLTLSAKDEERLCRFIAAESWETIISAYRIFWEQRGKAFWIFLDDFGEWKKQLSKVAAPVTATSIPALEEMRAEVEQDRAKNPNWEREAALGKRNNHLPLTPDEEELLAEADAPTSNEDASDSFPESEPSEPEISEEIF